MIHYENPNYMSLHKGCKSYLIYVFHMQIQSNHEINFETIRLCQRKISRANIEIFDISTELKEL